MMEPADEAQSVGWHKAVRDVGPAVQYGLYADHHGQVIWPGDLAKYGISFSLELKKGVIMTKSSEQLAMQWKDLGNLLLGLWLVVSPWAAAFAGDTSAATNAWITGGLIAVLAAAALISFQKWEEWINALLGVWLIASPFILGLTANMTVVWNLIIVGVLVAILAIWAAATTEESGNWATSV
jgi:uncharacterized membrane protein